jgi:hypothetical protein
MANPRMSFAFPIESSLALQNPHTSAKLAHNPFGIRNSKTKDLRAFRVGTSKKNAAGLVVVNQKSDKGFLSRAAIGTRDADRSPGDQSNAAVGKEECG